MQINTINELKEMNLLIYTDIACIINFVEGFAVHAEDKDTSKKIKVMFERDNLNHKIKSF